MAASWLLGVPGSLKTLKDRLTSGRASNLDEITATRMARVDATISSRATQTSVNTVDGNVNTLVSRLTSGRASNLDDLDAPVSGIPTANIKAHQSGFFEDSSPTSGTGLDDYYIDIAVSPSMTPDNTIIEVRGGNSDSANSAWGKAEGSSGRTSELTGRLTSSSNLRISSPSGSQFPSGGVFSGYYHLWEMG